MLLVVMYLILKRRIRQRAINSEVSVNEQQLRSQLQQQQMSIESEHERIENAKRRVLLWIESQLTISKYSDIKDKG